MTPKEQTFPVHLYVYDMSKGLAKNLSRQFLGREIGGLWHTAIVIHEREYFFGGAGIQSCTPMMTMLGHPDEAILLGRTEITEDILLDYLGTLASEAFAGSKYDLFKHNCNNFSNELAVFLTGKEIPNHILSLPNDILNSPFGPIIHGIMSRVTVNPGGATQNIGTSRSPRQPNP